MEAMRRQQQGSLKPWLWTFLLMWACLLTGVSAGEQAPRYRIGVLTSGGVFNQALEGLREGLAELGHQEGNDLAFMVEDVQGDIASLTDRAAKIVAAKPNVIFTIATAPTAAAKQSTTTLPIVFAVVADPLRSGFVASYASSQNNLSGVSNYAGPLSGKRLELLQELAPGIKHVLAIVAPRENVAEVSFQFLAASAPKLGIDLLRYDVTDKAEIESALKAMPRGAVDAIYHVPSSLVGTQIDFLIHKAKAERIPLAVHEPSMVEQGALISYGADFRLLGIQAAKLVTKIMAGAKPSELPVQTPEKLLLTINLTTAKAIGIDIPRSILERTDRLVE